MGEAVVKLTDVWKIFGPRAEEAMAYNGLVQSWPEIVRLSREKRTPMESSTGSLFSDE